jgi:hypothetical protein
MTAPSTCQRTGKKGFPTPRDAERRRRQLKHKGEKLDLDVYRCPFCHRWHLGHGDPPPPRK